MVVRIISFIIIRVILDLCWLTLTQIHLQVFDSVLLAAQQKVDLVVDELELPGHLLVDVIDLVHGTD